nr:MAG TPA: KilAC domain protein [Caudoviricetes sp.]
MQLVTLNESHEPIVSGRTLHRELGVGTEYAKWMTRMTEYGFVEGQDFNSVKIDEVRQEGNRHVKREITDHALKLDMAKEIAMIQRTEKGKEVRQYFIQVERDYNSPEKIMARALLMANNKVLTLETQVEELKPKALFADAVAASKTSILIGELAKLLNQNGVKIGGTRLFAWMRENGYLIKRKGQDWNTPTQRAMEMDLFEIKERTHSNPDGSIIISKTTKVTGKGQQYFINKFLR